MWALCPVVAARAGHVPWGVEYLPRDMLSLGGQEWTCGHYVQWLRPGLGMSRGVGAVERVPYCVLAAPEAAAAEPSGVWSSLGSSLTITALETGVLLPSAVWFRGTSTLASG